MTRDPVDVLVVGGGPAGLSAALVLGRAGKRVLVCDAGARRNATATHVHGFLGTCYVRCDDYNGTGEYRRGRYWDNAHNPGKGEWNMELQIRSFRGGLPSEETKFFKFRFGTEDQCIEACKEWAAFGKLPGKE